jgi:hypothetical protein
MTSVESSHEVPKLEKYFYYFCLRGNRHLGPKLVFRTSTVVFAPPTGPEHDPRFLESCSFSACTIATNWARTSFGKLFVTFLKLSILRTDIRSKVVKLLDNQEIQHTSFDLARFRWDEQNSGRETVTSRVTIWVGVLPDRTTGNAAFES